MGSYMQACRDLQSARIVMWFTQGILISIVIWGAHYLSAFLTVGSMVMLDLRILGVAGKSQTMTQVCKIYSPWMWTGIAVLSVTGLLMLSGDAVLFCDNGIFGMNLLITFLAVISGIVIFRKIPSWDSPAGAPLSGKLFALVSLLLWVGTILSAVEVPARSNVP
jgi:hypothetical protein